MQEFNEENRDSFKEARGQGGLTSKMNAYHDKQQIGLTSINMKSISDSMPSLETLKCRWNMINNPMLAVVSLEPPFDLEEVLAI